MTANRLLTKLSAVAAIALALARPAGAVFTASQRIETGVVTGLVYYGPTERIRGFDPVTSADVPSAKAIYKVYEGLYEYEYLARPYRARPNLAEAMPDVSPDGLTYTFRLRKGVRFADDPCFAGGKGREVTAEDFIYSWKRVADVRTKSNCFWIFEGRVAGIDEYHKASMERPVSYDEPVEGFQALDRYTIQIKLTQPYPQLIWVLTMSYTFVVPREAVEHYGAEFLNHPVGTGAYKIADWTFRNYGITYIRNPNYHGDTYPAHGEPGDTDRGLLDDAGKPIPFIDQVTQYVIADTSTEWLMFLSGRLGQSGLSKDNFSAVISAQKELTPELKARGIWLDKSPELWTVYIGFNMEDPIVGASKDPDENERHRKLRQALCYTVDIRKWCEFYNGRQMPANSPIPPGMAGHDPNRPLPYPRDIERARQLIAEAGYPDGRDPKTGRRLTLTVELGNASEPEERQSIELMASFFAEIGVELVPSYNNWPEFLKKMERTQQQMFRLGWVADYPDAENFLQLFSSRSISPGPNHTNYSNPKFDELFDKARQMQDSPERTALYMKLADMVIEDCPWITLSYPLTFGLQQPWFKNYKFHAFPYPNMKFYKTDPDWTKRLP
jgi:ABC-type transport system substrate-binding protein